MEKNEYLCNVNKAEEQQFAILSSNYRSEQEERRKAQKKASLLEQENSALKSKNEDMQRRLNEKMDEVADTVRQMAQFMMGKGPVTLSDSLRDAIVAGVKEEFEAKLREEREAHSKEMQSLKDQFALMLAAKDNEIATLKAKNGDNQGESHGTVSHGRSIPEGMTPEDRNKQLEQQNSNLAIAAYGQNCESEKYNHGCQPPVNADDLDLNGEEVPDERVAAIAQEIKVRKDMKGVDKPRRQQPLEESILADEKRQIILKPEGMPEDVYEVGRDYSTRFYYVRGYIRCQVIARLKFRDPRGNYYHVNLPEKYKNCMGRTEATESLIAYILSQHFEFGVTIADIELQLKRMGLNFSHATIMNWIKIGADLLEPLDEPLQHEIINSGEDYCDESTVKTCDKRLPNKDEKEDEVEDELHYFRRWMYCHHAGPLKLTQFVFFGRGRRTQEAIKEYFKDVMDRLYLHSDGAKMYKCYNIAGLIIRISCLVHMRRPFFKLKDVSQDAMEIVKLADKIFHLDKKIKEEFKGDADRITQERVLQIGPVLHTIKNILDLLESALDKKKEPELFKAVKYALDEYPCLLNALQDGTLDFSNNRCERQIRRLAKYRNNSFFTGSPEAAKRLARLLSHFANCKDHHLDSFTYLCDVFRRINKTAKDELVNLLEHKWQPMPAMALA